MRIGAQEDLIYVDGSDWNAEDEAAAHRAQSELGLLKKVNFVRSREHEYPVDQTGKPRPTTPPSRNSVCSCGSGKRFKRCHGKYLSNRRPQK